MTSLDGKTNVAQGAANGSQPLLHEHGAEIQAFGTMRRLPLALALEARALSVQLLNQILVDSQILYALYKKHHWLVRGPTFHALHLLLDTHAAKQLELIDTLAERVQTLGGVAIADPRHVAEVTQIDRPPNGVEPVPSMLGRLLEAHEMIITEIRTAIEKTAQNGDLGTNDLLVGQLLRTHEQQVWFLAEHLVDTPLVHLKHSSIGFVIQPSTTQIEATLADLTLDGRAGDASEDRSSRQRQGHDALPGEMLARHDILPD